MVATAASRPAKFTGIRPFNPARDLFGVGRVLEEAFRPDGHFPLSNVPLLRDLGVFLWTLGYAPGFPDRISGLVWVEEGRIVGNVTITLDQGHLDRFFISNVAVKPAFRRRGLARQLVQTALADLRQQRAHWALLSVRPSNPDATRLYLELGFQEVEMNGEWTLPSPPLPLSHWERGQGVRQLRPSDHLAVKELVRAATPANVAQFRASRHSQFTLAWDERIAEAIADFFIGQTTRRYAVERNGKLIAVMILQAQRGPFPHRLAVQVHPTTRGEIERELIALALADLAEFPVREIRAAVTSTHPEFISALEQAGFKFQNGLTLMAMALA